MGKLLIIIRLMVCIVLITAFHSSYSTAGTYLLPDSSRKIFELHGSGESSPKIALALSGGGARGMAQIGVLEVLEENGIEINYIVGTSIGAIIGGLYSLGYTASQLDSIVTSADWENIFSLASQQNRNELFLDQKQISDRSLLTLRFDNFEFVVPEAISLGNRFYAFLQGLIRNAPYMPHENFDSLKIPFRAVATDLVKGRTVSLSGGNLARAIRASSTVPLRYSPVRMDSMVLVDGGLMANIPVKEAAGFEPALILAVNTISPLLEITELDKPWNLADQVVSIMMKFFSQNAANQAGLVLTPDISNHLNTDFTELDSLIIRGKEAAEARLPEIKQLIASKKDSIISNKWNIIKSEINVESTVISDISGFERDDSLKIRHFTYLKHELLEELFAVNSTGAYKSIEIFSENYGSSILISIIAERNPLIKKIEFSEKGIIPVNAADDINVRYYNKLYNKFTIGKIYDDVNKSLRASGHSFAGICSQNFDESTNTLYLGMDRGIINSIRAEGDKSISDFIILRDVEFKKGDVLEANKILHCWENLINTDLFSDVEIEIERQSSCGGVDIAVKAIGRGTQSISLGGRVDNERNLQFGLDVIQENLLNFGTRLSLRAAGGDRNRKAFISIEQPRLLSTSITFTLRTYYESENIYKYIERKDLPANKFEWLENGELVEQRYGFTGSFGTQIEKKGTLLIDIRTERQRELDLSSPVKPAYTTLNTLKIGTIFDTRDRVDFPFSGRLINLSLETSLFSGNESVSFSKAEFLYGLNFSFGRSTISPVIYFGFADATLPSTEFFSIGGEDNFYGKREDEQRGRQIAEASLEYRFKMPFQIFFDTYLSGRYDLGAIWAVPEEIKFERLQHGIGGCLAVDTPLGAARFSIGKSFVFLKSPAGISWGPALLYFSLGMKI